TYLSALRQLISFHPSVFSCSESKLGFCIATVTSSFHTLRLTSAYPGSYAIPFKALPVNSG
ncbi:MAG: hypothetical protein ACYT04_71875, partial [Nostoc sp.]